jgi:hypothetical protein
MVAMGEIRVLGEFCMRHLSALGVAFLMMAALVVMPGTAAEAAIDPNADALWDLSVVPATPNWHDTTGSVELGVRFITSEEVMVTGVRFYKGDSNTGTHFGTLWNATGDLLATGDFTDESSDGWQDLMFDSPVTIVPGQTYVASYWAPNFYYAAENDYFSSQQVTIGPITALQAVDADSNGVYSYSATSTFPSFSYRNTNYWVTPLWTTNAPPAVDAGPDTGGSEGAAISLVGTVSDSDPTTLAWTVSTPPSDGGSCTFSNPTSASPDITCNDDGTVEATLTASDGVNPPVSDTVSIAVTNANPSLVMSAGDSDPIAVAQSLLISATVTDPGANDTLVCSFDWGDGSGPDEVVPGSTGCAASHSYTTPNIHTVTMTVTDDDGGSASAQTMVVVFDASAGFVTGGGRIDSPAGAYTLDETLTGRATFGFVAKYKKGATKPSGNSEFQFRAGGLDFHSTSYDWLVVTGGDTAKFKGVGTVNRESGYQFMIWAGDATPDTFRIKIWTEDGAGNETVVYDNGPNQAIARGSVKIHRR